MLTIHPRFHLPFLLHGTPIIILSITFHVLHFRPIIPYMQHIPPDVVLASARYVDIYYYIIMCLFVHACTYGAIQVGLVGGIRISAY